MGSLTFTGTQEQFDEIIDISNVKCRFIDFKAPENAGKSLQQILIEGDLQREEERKARLLHHVPHINYRGDLIDSCEADAIDKAGE